MNRDKLIKIFLEKNSQINLSAIRDVEGVQVKHIDDSIELNKILKLGEGETPPKSSPYQGRTSKPPVYSVCDI